MLLGKTSIQAELLGDIFTALGKAGIDRDSSESMSRKVIDLKTGKAVNSLIVE